MSTAFWWNLITFSPLLLLAGVALYLIDRRDQLRRDAGLLPPQPEPVEPEDHDLLGDNEPGEDEPLLPNEPGPNTDVIRPPQPTVEDEDDEDDAEGPFDSDSEHESDPDTPDPNAPGPAQPMRPTRMRTIGPKKLRSIERRDQRRAYYEWLRAQAEQREEEERGLREEEAERAFENARRRALIAEDIAVRKEAERREREEVEEMERKMERKTVEAVRKVLAGKRAVEISQVARKVGMPEEWVEGVLKKEGLVGVEDGAVRMVTRDGWWICVGEEELRKLWGKLEEKGRMEWAEMGNELEAILT